MLLDSIELFCRKLFIMLPAAELLKIFPLRLKRWAAAAAAAAVAAAAVAACVRRACWWMLFWMVGSDNAACKKKERQSSSTSDGAYVMCENKQVEAFDAILLYSAPASA
jgi:hypothetical protein